MSTKTSAGSPARARAQMSVRMFGPLEVTVGERRLGPGDLGGIKPKRVLEILLAARGRSVTKERLADLLWGESLPRKVPATLETYVSVLRSRLRAPGAGDTAVATERGAYRFVSECARLDLDAFDRFVRLSRGPDHRASVEALDAAIALADRGEILADELYAEWAEELRSHYRKQVVQALVAEAKKDYQLAIELYIDAAQRWADFGFVLEEGQAHFGLARCLIALGDIQAARKPLQKAHATFTELGARPLIDEVGRHLGQATALGA